MSRGQVSDMAGTGPTTPRNRDAARRRSMASLVMATLLLGACSNLITGDSLKEKVQEAVGEANAKPVKITVQPDPNNPGGSPSLSGEVDEKIGVEFPLSTTVFSAYAFKNWTVSGSGTVLFTSTTSASTKVTVKAGPTSAADPIVIQANYYNKPTVTVDPSKDTGVLINKKITLDFSQEMDPDTVILGNVSVLEKSGTATVFTDVTSTYFEKIVPLAGNVGYYLVYKSGQRLKQNYNYKVTLIPASIKDKYQVPMERFDAQVFKTGTGIDEIAPAVNSVYVRRLVSDTSSTSSSMSTGSNIAYLSVDAADNIDGNVASITVTEWIGGSQVVNYDEADAEHYDDGAVGGYKGYKITYAEENIPYPIATAEGQGLRTIKIQATDGNGNITDIGAAGVATINYDTMPPAAVSGLSLTALAGGKVRLDWSNPGDSDYYSAKLSWSWADSSHPGSTTVVGPTSTYTTPVLTDGSYTFSVRSVDTAGNESSTASGTKTTDSNPPAAVTGLSATANSGGTVTLSWTNPGDPDYAQANISWTDGGTHTGSATAAYPLTTFTSGVLVDGSYTFSVTTQDEIGNIQPTAATKVAVADGTPPTVTITGPFTTSGGSTSLTALKKGDTGYYKVVFSESSAALTGASVAAKISAIASTATVGTISASGSGLTWNIAVPIGASSAEGTVGIRVAAGAVQDAAGNTSAQKDSASTFSVDNTPPTVTITGPFTTSGGSTSLTAVKKGGTGYYTVAFGESSATLTASGVASKITAQVSGASAGTISATDSGDGLTWYITVPVGGSSGEGTIGIRVAANAVQDVAGNTSAQKDSALPINVDNTAPTVTVTGPFTASGGTTSLAAVKKGGTGYYTVAFSESAATLTASGVASKITAQVSGASAGTISATDSGDGLTWYIAVPASGTSAEGTIGIRVAAGAVQDVAGNTSAQKDSGSTFSVDNTAPSVTITGPFTASGGTTSLTAVQKGGTGFYTVVFGESSVSLTAAAVEASLSANVSGATVGTITATDSGDGLKWYVAMPIDVASADGTVGLRVAAGAVQDAVGNPSAQKDSTASFAVDTTPPTVTITGPFTTSGGSTSLTALKKGDTGYYKVVFSESNAALTGASVAAKISAIASTATVGTISASGSGLTWNISVPIGASSAEGTVGIRVAAGAVQDALGNLSTEKDSASTFSVDNTPPTVTITGPFTTSGGSTSLTAVKKGGTGYYTVAFGESSATLTASGVASKITAQVSGASAGTISATDSGDGLTWYITVPVGGSSGEGTIGIRVAANAVQDVAGNTSAQKDSALPINVDNTAPTVTVTGPFTASGGTTSLTAVKKGGTGYYTVAFSESAATLTASGVASKITAQVSGASAGTISATDSGDGLTWYIAVPASGTSAEGTIGIRVAAGAVQDVAGNTSAQKDSGSTFSVDNTAPSVTITGPFTTSGGTTSLTAVQKGGTGYYTVAFGESSAILDAAAVEASLSANVSGVTVGTITATDSGDGLKWYVAMPSDGASADGTVGLRVAAGAVQDAVGNPSAQKDSTASFVVDTTPPSQNGTDTPTYSATTLTLKISADASGVTAIKWGTVSSGPYGNTATGLSAPGAGAAGTVTATISPHQTVTFYYVMLDAAGNQSEEKAMSTSDGGSTFTGTKSIQSGSASTKVQVKFSEASYGPDPYAAFSSFYGRSAQASSVEEARVLAQNASLSRTRAAARLPTRPASPTAPVAAQSSAQPAAPAQAVVYRPESGATRGAAPIEPAKTDEDPRPARAGAQPTEDAPATLVSFSTPAQPAGGSQGQKLPSPQPQDGRGRMPPALLAPSTWREEEPGRDEA